MIRSFSLSPQYSSILTPTSFSVNELAPIFAETRSNSFAISRLITEVLSASEGFTVSKFVTKTCDTSLTNYTCDYLHDPPNLGGGESISLIFSIKLRSGTSSNPEGNGALIGPASDDLLVRLTKWFKGANLTVYFRNWDLDRISSKGDVSKVTLLKFFLVWVMNGLRFTTVSSSHLSKLSSFLRILATTFFIGPVISEFLLFLNSFFDGVYGPTYCESYSNMIWLLWMAWW